MPMKSTRCSNCGNPTDPLDLIDGLCDGCVDKLLSRTTEPELDSMGRYNIRGRHKANRKSAPSTVWGVRTKPNRDWQV